MIRHPANPILTRDDIPAINAAVNDVTSVFNPGAIRWNGRDILMLRVQTRGRETVLMLAESDDGVHFRVRPSLVEISGLDSIDETIYHIYDPRPTRINESIYLVFAADVDNACRLGIARSNGDLESFELVTFIKARQSRNGVLFPEQIGGKYLMLERPNVVEVEGGVTTGEEIVLSESTDMKNWTTVGRVMSGRCHYWDELIGSGPPPVKTRDGWLHVYHGVARHFAAGIYQAGVVLLDLDDPRKVIARSRNNILEPRETWELIGQVPNVVFPSGMIADEFDADGFAKPESAVRLYYGAADTVVGLAESTVQELLDACRLIDAPPGA